MRNLDPGSPLGWDICTPARIADSLCALLQLAALEAVAQQYGATTKENTRLNNEVQDLRRKIRSFCRLRPAGATGQAGPSRTEVGVDGQVRPAVPLDPDTSNTWFSELLSQRC